MFYAKIKTVGNRLMSIGFWCWVTETIFFLIRDGWHTKATDQTEKLLDTFSGVCCSVGLLLIAFAVIFIPIPKQKPKTKPKITNVDATYFIKDKINLN